MDNFLHRGLCQLEADDHNDARHRKAGQVLIPGVAVGMVLVGGAFRQLKTDERHKRAAGIGEVVHRVRHHGNGAGEQANEEFRGKEQNVAPHADHAGQPAAGRPVFRLGRIHIFWQKFLH